MIIINFIYKLKDKAKVYLFKYSQLIFKKDFVLKFYKKNLAFYWIINFYYHEQMDLYFYIEYIISNTEIIFELHINIYIMLFLHQSK